MLACAAVMLIAGSAAKDALVARLNCCAAGAFLVLAWLVRK